MPEYRTPGVYIEERDTGPRPIAGVGTSTVGMLGRTERGPTDPRLVTSFSQFERLYGGFDATARGRSLADSYTVFGVEGFFRNGGTECVFGRVVGEDATVGEGSLGAVEALLVVSETAVDFGDVVTGHAPTRTVALSNPGEAGDPAVTVAADDLTLTVTDGAADEFDLVAPAAADFPLTVDPGTGVDVTVELTPADAAPKAATLVVDHDGTNAPARVAFAGTGVDPTADSFGVEPTQIDFGAAVDGHQHTGTVTVRNLNAGGGGDLPLTAAELTVTDPDGNGEDAHFAADFPDGEPGTVPAGGTADIEVTFAPDGAPGAVDVELQVAAPGGTATVTLTGTGVGPTDGALGVPNVATPTLDLGTLVATDRTTGTITLTNLGDGDPAAGHAAIEVDPAGMQVVADPNADPAVDDFAVLGPETVPTLAPGGRVAVAVRFEPTATGTRSAQLRVPFEAGGTPGTATVALTGEAVDPAPLAVDSARLDFGRVEAGDAEVRTLVVTNTAEASGMDVRIDADDVTIRDASGDSPFALTVTDPAGNAPAFPVDLAPGESLHAEVTFAAADLAPRTATLAVSYEGDAGANPRETVTVPLAGNRDVLDLHAIGPGEWGERVAVAVADGSLYDPEKNQLFKLLVRYWSDPADAATARRYGGDPADDDRVPEPTVEEVYDDLSPVQSSGDFYENRLASSALVAVEQVADGRPESTDEPVWLGSADDGRAPILADYDGTADPAWRPDDERTGLDAFVAEDEIAIVCVPGSRSVTNDAGDPVLTQAIVDHCETLADRFAVLQAPQVAAPPGDLSPPRDSEYAAFYYPWIETTNPATNRSTLVPPGGSVAGIYARSDTDRGVHKAPANEIVRGANGLQRTITKSEQAQLNPRGVNCIRSFPGRGIRVWGARTTSSDPLWKYVNVRRLFLYLEESIDEATQYAVFEPNDESLWAQIRQAVSNFLTTTWRNGALMGSTPEEAFYVKCDETTMTQDDIDNGRLIVEIGVAPVKPAEFVIFRISQKTGEGA
jgi:phage tail sheath protein FI